MTPVFRPFGLDHLALLGTTAVGLLALGLCAPRVRRLADDSPIRAGLAVWVIGTELVSWGYAMAHGWWGLPLQLCDLAVMAIAFALLGRPRLIGEVACCWGLAGSSQAVFTPDLREGFPTFPWATFFLGHCSVIMSAAYLVVRGRVRLTMASAWRVWGVSNGYLVVAGLVNWRLGTNFGYLAHKPFQPSLLDYLGPWPFYILAMELIALMLFCLCVAINRLIDWWAGVAAPREGPERPTGWLNR